MAEKPAAPTASGNRENVLDTLELSLFCHQMALVLKSGINPIEGVPLIAEEIGQPRLKAALEAIGSELVEGTSLSEALGHQGIFPEYLTAMTHLGENTGMLDRVMENLAQYYDRDHRLRRKFLSSITYPCILMVLMLGVILLLVLKILPMFASILSSLGGDLPQVTAVLLSASLWLQAAGPYLVGGLLVVIAGLWLYGRTPAGQLYFDRLKLTAPYFGPVYKKVSAARFSHGMSLILRSGMSFESGMEAVGEIITNRYVRGRILEAEADIRSGMPPAEAFQKLGLYPSLFVRMMRIGHKTGELDQMMAKISDVYDNEVEDSLNTLANAIEPVLVIILSAIVAVILLAVMLPLINIMSTIG